MFPMEVAVNLRESNRPPLTHTTEPFRTAQITEQPRLESGSISSVENDFSSKIPGTLAIFSWLHIRKTQSHDSTTVCAPKPATQVANNPSKIALY